MQNLRFRDVVVARVFSNSCMIKTIFYGGNIGSNIVVINGQGILCIGLITIVINLRVTLWDNPTACRWLRLPRQVTRAVKISSILFRILKALYETTRRFFTREQITSTYRNWTTGKEMTVSSMILAIVRHVPWRTLSSAKHVTQFRKVHDNTNNHKEDKSMW